MIQFKTAFLKLTPQKNHHENLIELQIWGTRKCCSSGMYRDTLCCFTQGSTVMLVNLVQLFIVIPFTLKHVQVWSVEYMVTLGTGSRDLPFKTSVANDSYASDLNSMLLEAPPLKDNTVCFINYKHCIFSELFRYNSLQPRPLCLKSSTRAHGLYEMANRFIQKWLFLTLKWQYVIY